MVWYGVTQLGDGFFVYLVVGFEAVVFLFKERTLRSFGIIGVMFVLFLSNPLFKIIFKINRPIGFASFYEELTTSSFPSGHSVNAVIIFFLVPRFYQFIQLGRLPEPDSQRERISSFVLMLFGAMMVAMSRVFLGVHWFSDVMTGLVWGGVIHLVIMNLLILNQRSKVK